MPLKPEDVSRPQWSSKDPWSPVERPPGAYPPSPNPDITHKGNGGPKTIAEAVKARKDEYVRKKTIKVKVGTWNVAALGDTYKDLGGWFAQGLGIKGMKQDQDGLQANGESTDGATSDSEIENVTEQEARHHKKSTTLPRHDLPGEAGGNEVDLYVLGLQEVIDVSSVAEAMKPYTDPNPAKRWKRALKKKLPRGYKKVVEHQLIGLLLLVFASPELAPEISSVDSTSVGTGLMGYLGNKGAVSARILVGETTRMLFVNCHLAAGADATALARRIWDTQQIVSRTRFHAVGDEWVGGVGQSEGIGDEDIAFWFGDLNYRLDDIPGEDVRRLLLLHARNEYDILNKSKRKIDSELGYKVSAPADILQNSRYENSEAELPATVSSAEPPTDPQNDPASLQATLRSLLTHDQLYAQQRARKAFHEGWREGDINFLPTYKYDIGSVAMFDSGEKKRSPSWCDRILYRTRLDYENYFRQIKQEAEAKKKDEEMKKRGLDEAASQEDILFDYDPEIDGDDYDDQIEQHDSGPHLELIRNKEGFEDAILLENYSSHQRVLSSDHKPLSAVFKLTYDSVNPALKAIVHQQVSREFDKAENEARPAVTLVLDNHPHATSGADNSSDVTELKVVDFGDVRYHVQYNRRLTIANTGQIEATFAFVSKAVEGSPASPFPSWLKVAVHQGLDETKIGLEDPGTTQRYKLEPGETTSIELVLEIQDAETVKQLNSGEAVLDDVLVLRITNGRDYFIPVRGSWLQTCFYRSIDELVRVSSGVRSLTMHSKEIEAQHTPPTAAVHSAPQEIFMMTDLIPKLVERVVADWDMLHQDDEPPWKTVEGPPWPFDGKDLNTDPDVKNERLAECREALDKAEPFDEHLSTATSPAERLELVSEVLISFLESLADGIITPEVWQEIEKKIHGYEKAKAEITIDTMQEIVMEAVSSTPVHSVSLTFVTFMLNRIISEVSADSMNRAQPTSSPVGRSRSSTSASAMSDVSLGSVRSNGSSKTRRWMPSTTRRTAKSSAGATSSRPTASETDALAFPLNGSVLTHRYAGVFAPIVIRSDDSKMKAKDQKVRLARKTKALESFLNSQP